MKKYLPYVNAKMGTKSLQRRSYGNTLPLTQLPFGMASFCLQTESRGAWFYHPEHEFCEGVRLTHQPSPWIGDYGTFVMIPQNDSVSKKAAWAWSGYRPERSVQAPDYLKLTFGSMSAWYIFASLGMYRLCPGKTEWIKCKRLVKQAKILGKEDR